MRRALLIATDTYGDPTFRALRAPRRDAEELEAVLRDEAIGGFRTEVLLNPSAQLLREHVDGLFTEAQHDDVVLLYVSGHGVKDRFSGHLHFATTDTRNHLLASTAVSAQFVRERIDHSLAAQVVVWLDCCYGGAFPSGMLPRSAGTVDVVEQLDEGRGCVVMTASTHIQYAYEPDSGRVEDRAEPSVFTKAIIEGLRTGDADLDGDGEISDRDLYGYVYERVRRESPDQTPTHSGVLSGDLRIAYAGTPLPRALPDELRRLLRSSDPALRLAGVRLLGTRADEGDPVARTTLEVLAAGPRPDLAAAATEALTSRRQPTPSPQPKPTPVSPPAPDPPPIATPEPRPTRTRVVPRTPEPVQVTPPEAPARPRPPFTAAALVGRADRTIEFSPDSALLASGSHLWNTRGWRSRDPLPHPGPMAFAPHGTQFAVARANEITIDDVVPTGRIEKLTSAGTVESLSFNHDRTLLAATTRPSGIELWEAGPTGWTSLLSPRLSASTRAFRFSAGGPFAVSASTAHTVDLWGTRPWRHLGSAPFVAEVVAVNRDATQVAAAGGGRVVVWRTSDWSRLVDLGFRTPGPLAFGADLRDLAVQTWDGLELWDLTERRMVQRIPTEVASVALSPDGRFLAATEPGEPAFRDVWVWARDRDDLTGLREVHTLPPPPARRAHLETLRRRARWVSGAVALAGGAVVPPAGEWGGTAFVLGLVLAAVLYLASVTALNRIWKP
ncbi:caspase, EACC1-associated type [Saccharothrix variisporea]|uniref:Putative caspase-like protein n=1 Tax=Saccharothrix variisporea TaxID=543527 RepID=A0A495X5Y3_9PSEU|nr:caspase family protein [Saccharothrix variisporea]RKT68939.1 putative caspase-like protein [Saccharothrix variisporea]